MRVDEKTVKDLTEEKVILEYVTFTKEFQEIKEYILQKGRMITVYTAKKEATHIRVEDILYFEAVGERVFAYTKDNMYEVNARLYQIEDMIKYSRIIRASKSILVNLEHIISVRSALNGRLYAKMESGEDILISRKYAKLVSERIMEDCYENI